MGIFDDQTDSSSNLDNLLYDPTIDKETYQMAKSVRKMQDAVEQAGIDPSETLPRESFLMNFLDTIDAPRQGVAGMIDTALRGDMFSEGVGTGFQRGQEENVTASDIFRRNDLIDNPYARGVVGFAADILTDPLTYLSFGAGTAAKQGGQVLTEVAGRALQKTGYERLAARGVVDPIEQGAKLDDAFRSMYEYQKSEDYFNKAIAKGDLDEAALEAKRGMSLQKSFSTNSSEFGPTQPLFDLEEVLGQDIFEKSKLRIGVNVPFLGHLKGEKSTIEEIVNPTIGAIKNDPGPVGQVMRAAGKIFSPAHLSIAELDVAPALTNAIDNIRLYANDSLGVFGKQLAKLEEIPVLGVPVKMVAEATNKVKRGFKTANEVFQKTFREKSFKGPNVFEAGLAHKEVLATAKQFGLDKSFSVLGPELYANKGAQREAALLLDQAAMRSVAPAAQAAKGVTDDAGKALVAQQADTLEAINHIKVMGESLDGHEIAIERLTEKSGANALFNQELQNLMVDPALSPEVRDTIVRTVKGMDELAQSEAEHGINYNRISGYLTHKYLNLAKLEKAQPSSVSGFEKGRKYLTLQDAFKEGGLVGDTDIASLIQNRFEKSAKLISQRRYEKRLGIEEGLDQTLVTKLYKAAQLNPAGSEAQVLKRYRIAVAPATDPAIAAKGIEDETRRLVHASHVEGNPEATALLKKYSADFSQKAHEEMWAAGFKPVNTAAPDHLLGEIGGFIPNGEKPIFVPKPVADAHKETVAARDLLKQNPFGQSAFGKSTIKLLDGVNSFFKKWTLIPFPAYYGQNLIGDRFRQLMLGIDAYNPGIPARTYSLMAGKTSIKNANGVILTKDTFDKVMRDMGIHYSIDDFIGTVDAAGDVGIEKYIAKKSNSMLENIGKGVNKANRQAALAQAQDKLQLTFDGFQRATHFVQRFEKGDGIRDAARSAQEAYFNYRDLSPIEQSLFRRFYMFYGYMSKATKSTLTDLVTKPGNITMQLHGTTAMAEFFSDPDAAPTIDQQDQKLLQSITSQEQLSKRIGTSPDGKPIVGRGFAAPVNAALSQFSVFQPRNFSVGELLDTAGDSVHRSMQKQFATSNPIINSLAQSISGKNLFFDKPLDSAFLRKVPDLTAAAERLAAFAHTDIPTDINDSVKDFLDAKPDGKGRLIANPDKLWILVNIVPGLGRAFSTAGNWTNTDISNGPAALRSLTGINVEDTDPSRTALATRQTELRDIMNKRQIKYRNEEDLPVN